MKFLLDSMLGKLAKWLRIMGYDTYYQPKYKLWQLYRLSEDRIFVTKNKRLYSKLNGILLSSDKVGEQIIELKEKLQLDPNTENFFTRCIICNEELIKAPLELAQESVPEYIFLENRDKIRYCPSCNRFYWPGTHRGNMLKKLKEWGIILQP